MNSGLSGQRIAFLASNEGMEQVEFTAPWQAVKDAGGTPELLAPEPGVAQAFNHLDKGDTFPVSSTIAAADPADYDGLVLPGGVANPDQLRTVPEAVQFVQAMFRAGKPAAVICHGPWTLVEADVIRGRQLTVVAEPANGLQAARRAVRQGSGPVTPGPGAGTGRQTTRPGLG